MNAQERHDKIFHVIRSAQMQPVPVFSHQGQVLIGITDNDGWALGASEVESRLSSVYEMLDVEEQRVARAIYMNLARVDSNGRPGARVVVLSDYT
jgi:hypothetical protein